MSADRGPNLELRALLAMVLSLGILIGYQLLFAPPPPEGVDGQAAERPGPEGSGEEEAAATGAAPPASPAAPAELVAGPVAAMTEERAVVETRHLRAVVTNRGGRLESLVLRGYRGDDGAPLDLVVRAYAEAGLLPLDLLTPGDPQAARAANEALHRMEIEAGNGGGAIPEPVTVTWAWSDGAGWAVRKRLRLPGEGYLAELRVQVAAPGGVTPYVALGPGLVNGAQGDRSAYLTSGAVLLRQGELEHWSPDDAEEPQELAGPLRWAGLESNYFLALFVPEGPGALYLRAEPWPATAAGVEAAGASGEPPRLRAALAVPPEGLTVPLYLGPKQVELLAAAGHDLQRAVDFGFFGFLAYPLLLALKAIHAHIGNYGLAIVLLTVLIKVLFLPLSHRSFVSMRKMQALQPQLAAIRARYKGVRDMQKRQQMNNEIMELYRRHGVSPFGGCLPLVLQIPVLFAFYSLLSAAIELRHAPLALWVRDLSKHDPYLVLPVLMGISMYAQQRMSPPAADPTQARLFRLMPALFTVFFLWLPSGLVLYWLVNNLLSIAQQAYVNRRLGPPPPPPRAGRPRKGGNARRGRRRKRGKR